MYPMAQDVIPSNMIKDEYVYRVNKKFFTNLEQPIFNLYRIYLVQ